MSSDSDKPGEKRVYAIVGAIAAIFACTVSCITIFTFLTGRESLPDALGLNVTPSASPPAPIETVAPTDPVSAADTPEPSPMPTRAPTTTPAPTNTPAPGCPAGITCYEDDFAALDPSVWCTVPEQGVALGDDQLVLTAPEQTSLELHPCGHLDSNLAFVELALRLVRSDGYPGNAHAGIGASLGDDSYLYLQVDSAGKVVLTHGLFNEPSQVDETVSLEDTFAPHILRIEWTGGEVLFSVDGSQLATRFSSGRAHWFLLTVSAWPDASIEASFDNVRWGVSR